MLVDSELLRAVRIYNLVLQYILIPGRLDDLHLELNSIAQISTFLYYSWVFSSLSAACVFLCWNCTIMQRLSTSFAVLGMIFFGTSCSLLAKLTYSVKAQNAYGEVAAFEKPWFQVFTMFLGMATCILLDVPRSKRTSAGSETAPLIPDGSRQQKVWIISISALLDLLATACSTTSLLYTSVSLYQIFRGALLVWTAFFSAVFLNRRFSPLHNCGIMFCIVGMGFVAAANIFAHSRSDTLFGIYIILVGQTLKAAQIVLEEYLLQFLHMSSVRVVAWEGLYGLMHCLMWVFPTLYFLPGSDHGRLEDVLDALYMVSNSWVLLAVISIDVVLMLFYNLFGLEVINSLSAIHRVVIETFRTLLVWVLDLYIYYYMSDGKLGEQWTSYSYLQVIGFVLMVIGTGLFNYDMLVADFSGNSSKATQTTEPSSVVVTPVTGYQAIVMKPSNEYVTISFPEGFEQNEGNDVPPSQDHVVGSGAHHSYLAAESPTRTPGSGWVPTRFRKGYSSNPQ